MLNQDLLPLKDYHKAKNLIWDPRELDLEQDKADWATMSDREKDIIRRGLSLFMAGEIYVTHDLAPLLIAIRKEGDFLEEEMFLTTQLFEESKHVEFFDRILTEVVDDLPHLPDIMGENYQNLFEKELAEALGRLLTDHSRHAQVEAAVTYHFAIEGVLAETAYYSFFTALKKKSLMPGLVRGLELVQRDEARHIAYGLHLLTRLIKDDPSLIGVIEARTNALLPLVQGIFLELLGEFLPDIPFELDLNEIVEYAGKQYMARTAVLDRAKPTTA